MQFLYYKCLKNIVKCDRIHAFISTTDYCRDFFALFKTFNVQIDSVNSKNLEEKKISVTF